MHRRNAFRLYPFGSCRLVVTASPDVLPRLLSQLDRPAGHVSQIERATFGGPILGARQNIPTKNASDSPIRIISSAFLLVYCEHLGLGRAATSYYFSASGSDSNNCRSPASPCRTIGKMNSLTYAAGDSIFFTAAKVRPMSS